MSPEKARYFELTQDLGVAPAYVRDDNGLEVPNPRKDEPDPLTEIGITVPVPTMAGGEVISDARRAVIRSRETRDDDLHARIIPGTRVVETTHPAVASVLLESGQYRECDPPKTKPKNSKES